MLFSPVEIQETVNMFMRQKLDIRCITMGISLLDCADSDAKRACDKIYDKIMKKASLFCIIHSLFSHSIS